MSFVHLLATDRQRSVVNATGSFDRAYTAYGWGAIQSGPLSAFCGAPRDGLTGCYHLGSGYRQYDPVIMRFQSPDALSPFDDGGLNAYMYCEADPVNRYDPSGAIPVWLPTAQRIFTATLHTISPVALIIGPAPNGPIALGATRLALAGSVTTLAGTGLGFAGVASAPIVSAAGTTMLMTGAGARVLNTLWSNRKMLWQSVKANASKNLRVIFRGRVEKPAKKSKQTPPNSPKKVPNMGNFNPALDEETTVTRASISISIEMRPATAMVTSTRQT